jgi:DNA-binding ferritin-like protein
MTHDVATFVMFLLRSSVDAHLMHWETESFSKHMALGEYYDGIVEKTDALAEAYMGAHEKLRFGAGDPIEYLKKMQAFVSESREHLPQDTELQNLVDEIAALIDSTLYKLRFLN